MKTSLSLFCACLLMAAISCSDGTQDRKTLSSVREADQKTRNLMHSVDAWAKAKSLAKTNPDEFVKFLYSVNPDLDRNVIRDLTSYNKIEPGEKISLRYHYFDKKGICEMENKKGQYTKVKFQDEIVVEVIRPVKAKFWVALSCLNGMLKIDNSPGISADASMTFVIEKGQGLSKYLADDYWAINVAEEFSLPLFRGKIQSKKFEITPSQARALVPNTSTTQITVYTEPGWKFVLRGNHWTLNGLTAAQIKTKH